MFFSVKYPLKMAGKTYLPCICYPLPRFLEMTVEKLVKEDKAVIYDEMVFFQNGKIIKTEKMLKAEQKEVRKAGKKKAITETPKEESEGF